jgi:hypothetical protein
MKLKDWIILLFMVAMPSLALAQGSVNGTWAGEVQGGRGAQQVMLTLKADGDKLTGSVGGGRGAEVPIEAGTIAGGTLKFKTTQQGRGGQVTMNWTGTLKGDEIAFSRTAEGQGQAQEFVLTRQK